MTANTCIQEEQKQRTTAKQEEKEDELHEQDERRRTNLDGGYAWLILLIMFLLQSSISGASRVYGIVFAKQVSIGYYDREQASTPIATASAVENLAGVLTPALAQRLSWRQIELLSALLFIGANLLAYASSSLWLDILALGIVQGLALSTSTVLSLAINNDYFEKYRTTAFGISMSGSTFGVLYLSPLVSWLLHDSDDFRQVYLMLALVFCFNIILVLFIKPRAETLKTNRGKNNKSSISVDLEHNRHLDETLGRSGLARIGSKFERHNSIASISYRARSRRQSILSRTMTAASAFEDDDDDDDGHYYDKTYRNAGGSMRLSRGRQVAATKRAPQRPGLMQINVSHLILAKSSSIGAELSNDNIKHHPKQQQQQQQQRQGSIYNTTTTIDTDLGSWTSSSKKTSVNSSDHQMIFMTIDAKLPANANNDLHLVTTDNNMIESSGDCKVNEGKPLKQKLSSVAFICEPRGDSDTSTTANGIDAKKHNKQMESQKQQQLNDDTNNQANCREFSLEMALELLRVPYLHCAWIMLALYYLIARIFIIILVDFATDHGFGLPDATNLLNYWSVGELCGRVLLGSLIDLKWMSCKSCITLTCASISGLIACMILMENYYVYATCSLLVAALISLEYMLINVMIVEYMGKSQVTSCYSIAAFISSLLLFGRPTLIGLFRDRLGSYDGLLWLLAATCLAYGLLFQLLEPILVRRWPPASAPDRSMGATIGE